MDAPRAARAVGSAGWILAAWIFTGALSFFGALAFAELGSMLPATGGQYVYLREAWGPLPAFLCGWTHFLISQSASIAFQSVSFAIYLSYLVPLGAWQAKGVALATMAVLTMVNYRGIRPGAMVQNVCTLAKIAGLAVIIASAFLIPRVASPTAAFGPITIDAFGVAMLLTPERDSNSLARMDASLTDEAYDRLADPGLEALRSAIPAARCLPLLRRLAAPQEGRVVLEYLDVARAAVQVEPCV